jgi:hypothetical protein
MVTISCIFHGIWILSIQTPFLLDIHIKKVDVSLVFPQKEAFFAGGVGGMDHSFMENAIPPNSYYLTICSYQI